MKIVSIIGCGKKKKNRKALAKNMYTSPYFNLKYDVADILGDVIIMSAKYGPLKPDDIIEPYDVTITDLDPQSRDDLGAEVDRAVVDYDRVVVMAGKVYRERLDMYSYINFFEGTGSIRDQMSRLHRAKLEITPDTLEEFLDEQVS